MLLKVRLSEDEEGENPMNTNRVRRKKGFMLS